MTPCNAILNQVTSRKFQGKNAVSISVLSGELGHLLLTWNNFNLNINMNKYLHVQCGVRLNHLSIPALQRHRWRLGMHKEFHPTLYDECNYLSLLGFELIHIRKRAPCSGGCHLQGHHFNPLMLRCTCLQLIVFTGHARSKQISSRLYVIDAAFKMKSWSSIKEKVTSKLLLIKSRSLDAIPTAS